MFDNTKVGSWIAGLDAFPKVDTAYLNRTTRGGLTTIICFTLMAYLMLARIGNWSFPPSIQRFVVDKTLGSRTHLNFDISIATPCEKVIVILGDDATETVRTLDGAIDMQVETFPWHYSKSAEKGKTRSVQGCRIKGLAEVNKVKGRLVFLPIVQAMTTFGKMLSSIDDSLNFSHVIHHLNFGSSYPGMKNPLEGSKQTTMSPHERFIYHLAIIPTFFSRQSWDGTGHLNALSTYQYSICGLKSMNGDMDGEKTGLHFRFDYEPLAVIISRDGCSFAHLLVELFGILGGIYTSSGVISNFVNWVNGAAIFLLTWRQREKKIKTSFDAEWTAAAARRSGNIAKSASLVEGEALLDST